MKLLSSFPEAMQGLARLPPGLAYNILHAPLPHHELMKLRIDPT